MSQTSSDASNRSIQNLLSGSCRILTSLAETAEEQGQQSAADRYTEMGQEVITTIANHIDNEELRTAF